MPHQERRLNAFVHAALRSFGGATALRALPPSAGGANHVFLARTAAGRVAVKLRVDRGDDARREAWALRVAPDGVAPRLLGHTTPRVLVSARSAQRRFTEAAALDAPVGGVLVLEHVDGAAPRGPLGAPAWARIARALRRVHAVRAQGPTLHVGVGPGSAARLAADHLAQLSAWGALDRATARDLARALRRAEAEARLAPRTGAPRLCHGDLRLHNVVDDGARAVLLDFEHAGIGDPIADLALFAVRTPLGRHDEQLLWEALLDPALDDSPPRTRRDLESFFRQRPLFSLVSAIAATADVVAVARSHRPVARDSQAYVAERLGGARQELAEVLGRGVRVRTPAPPAARSLLRVSGVIAVDGTASSGKSIVAAGVARALGARHVNTGLLFRAAAFLALESDIPPDARGAARLARIIGRCAWDVLDRDAVRVDQRVLDEALATVELERVVSRYAALAAVRAALGAHIERLVSAQSLSVVEGRAIAQRYPHARVALYVDAAPPVRAARLRGRLGRPITAASALALLRARDARDARRAIEPAVRDPRAMLVDTTHGDEADSIARALRTVRGALVRGRASS